jgi:hypothetical protein
MCKADPVRVNFHGVTIETDDRTAATATITFATECFVLGIADRFRWCNLMIQVDPMAVGARRCDLAEQKTERKSDRHRARWLLIDADDANSSLASEQSNAGRQAA